MLRGRLTCEHLSNQLARHQGQLLHLAITGRQPLPKARPDPLRVGGNANNCANSPGGAGFRLTRQSFEHWLDRQHEALTLTVNFPHGAFFRVCC